MTNPTTAQRFICSFCEQSFEVKDSHIGRCIRCAKCKSVVWVYPNRNEPIESRLTSTWKYKKLKFLVTFETVGPVSDEEFIALHTADKLCEDMQVFSPEFTGSQWIELAHVNLDLVRAQIAQRQAEAKRVARGIARRADANAKNRAIIQRAIVTAVSDGQVTLNERNQLFEFGKRAGIPQQSIESLLATESRALVESVIEEALEDGILEPHEKQRIGDLANGLGIKLTLTQQQEQQLYLCELAYKLAVGQFSPRCTVHPQIPMGAREEPICVAPFEWHEVTPSRRPIGIPLGDGHYLKPIAAGDCILTTKRVVLLGAHSAKKFTLGSVAKVTRYSDGVFFNRSSGKSVFLKLSLEDPNSDEWAMLAVHSVTGEPVLGIVPQEKYLPDESLMGLEEVSSDTDFCVPLTPRFTFRVVGDHVGSRRDLIENLELGDPLEFIREPSNPYDRNAIAVHDPHRQQLGYLKREVAEWFAPMLDGGRRYRVNAYRKPHSGGLITGVYELD